MHVSRSIRAVSATTAIATALSLGVAGVAFASDGGSTIKVCTDFLLQEDAQVFLEQKLIELPDIALTLDGDKNGRACEELPTKVKAEHSDKDPHNSDDADKDKADHDKADHDKDKAKKDDSDKDKKSDECKDFKSQAKAQAAFDKDKAHQRDLDDDNDKIACEDFFKTEHQQVAVHPDGSVATGGMPLR